MIEISLSNITLILGARPVLNELAWEIQRGQRIGLIGPNGAGKSSLFKLIVGEYELEPGGVIARAKGVTVGYLAQHSALNPQDRVIESALQGGLRWHVVYQQLEQVETSLADPQVYGNEKTLTRALERQHNLLEEYMALGGDQYEQRVRTLLAGLGLPEESFEKRISELSGGQRKLVGLTRLLLESPQVLLLDEPDNHLDLHGKVYLERLIQDYPGTVVIISHDRYLLDAVVTHIAELEDGHLTTFAGDYSSYMLDKSTRLARQEELFKIQERQVARIEAAIKRYAIWAKTYDNEKFAKRAKAIQNRLDRMERMDKPVTNRRRMDLRLNGWRGSDKVLELRGVTKTFDGQVVLDGVDLLLHHGERVGVIGQNGSGKSVLLRLALGEMTADEGEIIIGPSIRAAYYAQENETLDFNRTLIETVRNAAQMSETAAVAYLRRYLFSYSQASQKVSDLSGGERSRLQLALVVLSGANFLLLDEPTNNLDIASAEVLEAALEDFEGTVLIVSHDRYFLDQVVDQIIEVNECRLTAYVGGYSDYLAAKG